ncbi:kinesin-like protein KIF18B [Bombina bombina]|uniref:kinesin-like protein KIF18B n=1 Tax=Bombina bombina TaxID=8345 RepID=UPI00235B2C8E|nr:kinesin-like protein KIF18B [Bombina bombina]
MTMSTSSTPEEGNVSVVVRVRPPNQREQEGNQHCVVQVVDHNILIFDPEESETSGVFSNLKAYDGTKRKGKDLKFIFDNVFGENSKQQDVFEHTTKEILDGVLNGYNCSVFAYGATGAGKTHTMLGTEADPGVMYLTMVELYHRIEAIKEEKQCDVLISYLEVYNEQIQDLLEPKGFLAIREDPQKGVVVQGLSFHQPKSAEQLLQMLADGNRNRTQHPTDANASSSRSHAVFQIYVKQQDRVASINQDVRVAKMSLIDLAGSERASATNAKGERQREGANINRSLLALINVINALADAKNKKTHIPYRDSKLTRLLKDSIGGNCRTVMIAAVSPSFLSYDDTYNTLKYANRAKEIKLSLKSNVINLDCHISKYAAICEELKAEVAELKEKLRCYEMKEILREQSFIQGHNLENKKSLRLEEPLVTECPGQEYNTRQQHLGLKHMKRDRKDQGYCSQNSSFGGTEPEKSLYTLNEPANNTTDSLVRTLLKFVRKQYEILKSSNLQTPEIDSELQELEHLVQETRCIGDFIPSENKQMTTVCLTETNKADKDDHSQIPFAQEVVPDIKEEVTVAPAPITRKRQTVKRCRRQLLPDASPTFQSPVVPVKRRRQDETSSPLKATTPSHVPAPAVPSTPEAQVKRPRKSSIPSRNRPTLRSSANLLNNKINILPPIESSKKHSVCTPKHMTQASPIVLQHTVVKSRIPLGTSAVQNCASNTLAAMTTTDMNTTFDLTEDSCFIQELDKTVTFGTSEFPNWDNINIQNTDKTFGKSSDVAVFTMKGLSVKSTGPLASTTKSYSQRRRRSISTSTSRAGSRSLGNSRIARLNLNNAKSQHRPSSIKENIQGHSDGKKTGRGNVAFGRSQSMASTARFMQFASAKY